MTARTVPPEWRPSVSRDGGRYRLAFRGRDIGSVVSEFTHVDTMLGQSAATGVDRLLLSPWISLVPAEADEATARDVWFSVAIRAKAENVSVCSKQRN